MKVTEFTAILFEELNKIGPTIVNTFHATIDRSMVWDGKFDPKAVRATPGNSWRQDKNNFQLDILLSIGCLRITYTINDDDEVQSLEFSYHVPDVNRWFQPIPRNRLERGTRNIDFDNEFKMRKVIVTKFNSLLDGINDWYAESDRVNIAKFDVTNATDNIGWHSMMNSLMGTAGRVRLVAEIHKQRCAALGINSNAGRISQLTYELMEEVRIQLEQVNAFETVAFNESY